MSEPWHIAESRGGWSRRSRRYSPFNRSHGLRRLPDNGIGFAFICSVLLHGALIFGLVRATQAPPWSPGAATSLISMADLVPSVPASPQGAEVNPDRGTRRPTLVPEEASTRTPSQAAETRAAAPEPATLAGGPVALLSASDIDNPLDAGWPEPPPISAPAAAQAAPPPSALVTAQAAAPARALTPVPMTRGFAIAATPSRLAAEPPPAREEPAPTPRSSIPPLEMTNRGE